jgi:hypothetical protein
VIHLTVLDELRKVAPSTLTPGHLRSRMLDFHPDLTRDNVVEALKQLERMGMADLVSARDDERVSEWRAKS